MIVVAVTWWLLLLAGLVPAGWFLVRYRPSHWRDAPAVIMRGSVGVAFLAYLRPVVALAFTGGIPVFRGGLVQGVWGYTVLIGTDLLLLYLLRVFLRYRRAFAAELKRPDS